MGVKRWSGPSPARLTAKSVQGATLAFEGVHHVHGGHGLPLGVLRVGDGVADHVLQEHLQHPAGLLVDEAGDALHAAAASQAADGGLGDALDVISQDLSVALGSPLPQTLTAFSSSRHVFDVGAVLVNKPSEQAKQAAQVRPGRQQISGSQRGCNAGL